MRRGNAKWNGRKYAQDRYAAGYIAREVCDMVGISVGALNCYENNKATPDIEVASMLADILGYEVIRYIDWEQFG